MMPSKVSIAALLLAWGFTLSAVAADTEESQPAPGSAGSTATSQPAEDSDDCS
jgi:hypothetical protein